MPDQRDVWRLGDGQVRAAPHPPYWQHHFQWRGRDDGGGALKRTAAGGQSRLWTGHR